ncbi:MAG: TlyA family RNA methyltransferase [Chloroflexota bacterium]|nr:TlyA family RNA methyltransferase [Chloroflexota bacterium]
MTAAQRRRERLDRLLVERGLAPTVERAQALLLGGRVRVGEGDAARRDRKPGELVELEIALSLSEPPRYVSRGGEKLEAGLDAFGVDPRGRTCLDVGSSTGGFTDCLLRRGAARVYALDVGRGQLADSLRADPRVVSMERTHAGRLHPSHSAPIALPERVSLAVIDVSFISLTRVMGGVLAQLAPEGDIVALVKPQFELPAAHAPGGVVRDPAVRVRTVTAVREHAESLGLVARGEIESPLTGPAGNREFLLHLARRA